MRQLELFEGLEPIQHYLSEWNERTKTAKKSPARLAVHRAGDKPRFPVWEEAADVGDAACQRISTRRPAVLIRRTRQGEGSSE